MTNKIIDILPEEEQKRERILHAVKKVAQMQIMLNNAIDELTKEIYDEPTTSISESCEYKA